MNRVNTRLAFLCAVVALLSVGSGKHLYALGFQTTGPDHKHHADVNTRGDQAMGYSHEKTTHHFRLKPDGGVIEVSANDPKDGASRDQIRHHLTRIAELFRKGDFSLPMFTHGQAPPGTPEMTRLKDDIKYTFEAIDRGGRVLIASASPEAVNAIHQFLRFQIEDHKTGDPTDVEKQ